MSGCNAIDGGIAMASAAELTLIVCTACNALRVAAFLPQLVKIARHPQGAAGFSYPTWTLFLAANASTALYAGACLRDAVLAWTNGLSAGCCLALLALAAWRSRHPLAVPAARSGTPARCRSARKSDAQGSARMACTVVRRRSMLLNGPLRSTVAYRAAASALPSR
jgi:cyanate permease